MTRSVPKQTAGKRLQPRLASRQCIVGWVAGLLLGVVWSGPNFGAGSTVTMLLVVLGMTAVGRLCGAAAQPLQVLKVPPSD